MRFPYTLPDTPFNKPLEVDVDSPELTSGGPIQKPFYPAKQLEAWLLEEVAAAEKAGDPEMLALARSNLALFREVTEKLNAYPLPVS